MVYPIYVIMDLYNRILNNQRLQFLKLLASTNTSMQFMILKCYAKELKGIGSMAIFNLLHKVCCKVRQKVVPLVSKVYNL